MTTNPSLTCSSRCGADPRRMEKEDAALSGSLYLNPQQHIENFRFDHFQYNLA
jgi:hypothetical protein